MDKSKQTAVEWLEEIFLDNEGILTSNQLIQAKAFEKQQIIDAFIGFDSDTDDNIEVAQVYYKEFYGK